MALPKPSPDLAAKLEAIRRRYEGFDPTLSEPAPLAPPTPPAQEPGTLAKLTGALGVPKRYLVDLPINYASTEPLRERAKKFVETGDEQFAPIPAGELAKDAYIGRPEAGEAPSVQHGKAVGRALVGRFIDITTDPLNIIAGGGAAALAAKAPLAAKALAAGFGGMMAKGVYDATDEAYHTYRKEGWTPAVSEKAAEAAVDAGFLGSMFLHGPRGKVNPETGMMVWEPDFGTVRRAPLETREAPRVRGQLAEPVIDAEYTVKRGGQLGPGEEPGAAPPPPVPPPAPPPPPAEPPAPPPPAPPEPIDVAPTPKTPYEKPTAAKMSQEAVQHMLDVLDGRIAEAEAKGLAGEVAELTKLRQGLGEAYTVRAAPPPPPAAPPMPDPRAPYEAPAVLDENALVTMIVKLQAEAEAARAAGDLAKAAQRQAVAESIREQMKARKQAAPPPPPAPAPDATVPGAGLPAEGPPGVPGPRAGTEMTPTVAPEPLTPLEPTERVPTLVAETRPGVQDLLDRAEGGGLPTEAGLDIVSGRPPRDLAVTGTPEVPAAPPLGGTPVPETPPAPLPPPAAAAPLPPGEAVIDLTPPPAAPAARGPIPLNVQPIVEFLSEMTEDPQAVTEFFDKLSWVLPPDRPWTVEDIDFAASRLPLNDDLVNATKLVLAAGVPEPELTPEQVAAAMAAEEAARAELGGRKPGHSLFGPPSKPAPAPPPVAVEEPPPVPELPPVTPETDLVRIAQEHAAANPVEPPAPGVQEAADAAAEAELARIRTEGEPPAPAEPVWTPGEAPLPAPGQAGYQPTRPIEVGPVRDLKPNDVVDLSSVSDVIGWGRVRQNDRVGDRHTLTVEVNGKDQYVKLPGNYLVDIESAPPRAEAPAPRVEQSDLAPEPTEDVTAWEDEPIGGEPMTDEDALKLAEMLTGAREEQVALGEAAGLPARPDAEDVAQALLDFGIEVDGEEAARIADIINGEAPAGLTEPAAAPTIQTEEAPSALEEEAGPGVGELEGPAGVPLPEELPVADEATGGERDLQGVPEPEGGAVPGDRGAAGGEGTGVLPGGGVGGGRDVRTGEPAPGPAIAGGGGVDETPAPTTEPEPPLPPQAPASAPEGALHHPEPADPPTPAPPTVAENLEDYQSPLTSSDPLSERRSWSVKLADNISAIKLLKDLEATGRRATPEEQATLSKYVGWGGMPKAFDAYSYARVDSADEMSREKWSQAHDQLRELLTEEEWQAAALSTPNAHYTSAAVVRGMWSLMQSLGVQPGQRVLEPSVGIGNFFMLGPRDLRKTGVELDPISGRIARYLTPSANIQITGLEKTALPDNFYDFAIGNPPFGKIKVFDPAYKNDPIITDAIHNFMFVKALDKVRPGGIVAFVTSRYTMDAVDTAVRRRILDRADLISAIRLPSGTFQRNAGTQVVTDVLVFRKRPVGEAVPKTAPWLDSVDLPDDLRPKDYYGKPLKETDEEGRVSKRNAVFAPKGIGVVLGQETLGRGMHSRDEYMVKGDAPTADEVSGALLRSLKAAGIDPTKDVNDQLLKQLLTEAPRKERPRLELTPDMIRAVKPGNFIEKDGTLYERVGDALEEIIPPDRVNPELAETEGEKKSRAKSLEEWKGKVRDYIGLRDLTKDLLAKQVDPEVADTDFTAAASAVEKKYDAFVKKHGYASSRPNVRDLQDDTDFPNVLALEKEYQPPVYRGTGKNRTLVTPEKVVKSDILKKRLAGRPVVATSAESTREAYAITLGETGRLDWDRMAALTGKPVGTVQDEAKNDGLVFMDPASRQLVMAEEYLSGEVRKKLKLAEAAAKDDPSVQPNVDALRGVVPAAKGPANIKATMGVGWIPSQYLVDFLQHLASADDWQMKNVEAYYLEPTAAWDFKNLDTILGRRTTAGNSTWGYDYYPAADAIYDILSMRMPKIMSEDEDGNKFFDPQKTELAKDMKGKIEQEWQDWLWKDPERTKVISEIFNDNFYGSVPRHFDGSHLILPGVNRSILRNNDFYDFQKNAIWMMLQNPNTLVALPVGAGKTYTAVAAIMEARRMGTARKPVVAAPRAVVQQWTRAFKALYPSAQILSVDPSEMSPASRGRLMSKIATGDYDAVIVTHEGLGKLPLAPETVDRMIGEELAVIDRAFEDLLRDNNAKFQARMEPQIKQWVENLVTYRERIVKLRRDPRYRADKNAKIAPNPNKEEWGITKKAEEKADDLGPLVTVAEYQRLAKPATPAIMADPEIKAMFRGQAAATTRLIKQLATAKLNLKAKVEKMIDTTRRDRNISFEQLGVDMLVVDESHAYKNLYFTSQMERVPGLNNAFSDRSFDMYMKTRIIQERNGGRGLHFLTGTPLTNTIAEMYVLMRFLNPKWLKDNGIEHFDSWARNYATVAHGIEVDPTGAGMRTQARFNKFINLGSLLRAFRSFTYYKPQAELGLDLPKHAPNESGELKPRTVIVPKTDLQAAYVKFLIVRAKRVKEGGKDIKDDNPLLITTDGRKAALDMRLVDPDAPDEPNSKLNQATRKIHEIWKATSKDRATQLVFLDFGTPGDSKATTKIRVRAEDGHELESYESPKLNLYDEMRKKLIAMGVPRDEMEFIHDWQSEKEGAEKSPGSLYDRVNEGAVRIMFASSAKGGVGVNVQKRMIALHHLDVPFTPDKLEQREGRIIRQGNMHPEVQIYNWVAKGTFDIYMWQLVQQKASFISNAMSGNLEADEVEDLSFTALTAEEVIALGSDNPLVRDRMVAQKELEKLERLFHGWQEKRRQISHDIGAKESLLSYHHRMKDVLAKTVATRTEALTFRPEMPISEWEALRGAIVSHQKRDVELSGILGKLKSDTQTKAYEALLHKWDKHKADLTSGKEFTDKAQIEELLYTVTMPFAVLEELSARGDQLIGRFRGLPVTVSADLRSRQFSLHVGHGVADRERLQFNLASGKSWNENATSTLSSLEAVVGVKALAEQQAKRDRSIETTQRDIGKLKEQQAGGFGRADEIIELQKKLWEIEEALGLHKKDDGQTTAGDGGDDEGGQEPPPPPEDGDPDDSAPDPDDDGTGGPGPGDRPDRGAQPGSRGWSKRVSDAKTRTKKRGRGAQANLGVDPQAFWDAAVIGMDVLMKGARTFARWVAGLVSGLRFNPGENMLKRLWRTVQEWRRARMGPARKKYRPVADEPVREPGYGRDYRRPRQQAEEVKNAARAADEGPTPAWDKPGGKPDFDVNLHRVKDEGGLRDLQARMVANLERSLGRKAREVRTWAEVRAEAVLAGITEADFYRMLKQGKVTDLMITAGRMLRQESAKNVQAALGRFQELRERAKAATGSAKELLEQETLDAEREYLAQVAQYAGITADTVAAGAEAGRALAAHRMLMESLTPEERFIKRTLRGFQPNEKQIAALTDALMRRDNAAIAKIARQIMKPGAIRMLSEYFINSILSGLATPAANVLGNLAFMKMLTGERVLASKLESTGFRQWIERALAGTETPQERVGGEAWEMAKALHKAKFGLPKALAEAWRAFKNEDLYSGIKGEFHTPSIPGRFGKWVRTPGRVMDALDVGAKAAAKSAEKAAQVIRAAVLEGKKKGWNAEKVQARMREIEADLNRYVELENARRDGVSLDKADMEWLVRNRTTLGQMMKSMDSVADVATLRDDVTKLTRYLMMARGTYPWLTFLVPFIKTPERILVQAVRRTPVGLAKTLYNVKKGTLKGGEAADRIAAGMIGSMVSGGIYMAAADGLITGGGPSDPAERRNWEKTGKKPYAVKVGKKWISLARIEPLATTLGFAADLAEAKDAKTAGDVWDKLHYSVINNVANKTYLTGIINVAEALGDPERYGARMQKQLVGALVPNLLASAARAIDPTMRQADDISSTLLSRIPFASTQLPAKLTGTGEPVMRGEAPISRFMSPFRYSTEAGPEANLERLFLETGYNPAAPPKDITMAGRKVMLNAEERAIYAAYASRATAFARTMAQNRDWSGLDTIQKEEILRRIYRFAHDAARRDLYGRVLRRVKVGDFKTKET